jgi:hypothetical protein
VADLAVAVGADAGELVAAAATTAARGAGDTSGRCHTILRLEQRRSGQDAGRLPFLRRQLQRALQPTALYAAAAPR